MGAAICSDKNPGILPGKRVPQPLGQSLGLIRLFVC